MRGIARRFRNDQNGATSIEYALIASLMCMAIVSAATNVGQEVADLLGHVASEYQKVK